MNELKPCPFCGKKPTIYQDKYTRGMWIVECTGCWFKFERDQRGYAVEAWNSRPVEAQLKKDYDEVKMLAAQGVEREKAQREEGEEIKGLLRLTLPLAKDCCSDCQRQHDPLHDCRACQFYGLHEKIRVALGDHIGEATEMVPKQGSSSPNLSFEEFTRLLYGALDIAPQEVKTHLQKVGLFCYLEEEKPRLPVLDVEFKTAKLRALYDRMANHSAQLLEKVELRPMREAPRNGKSILLYSSPVDPRIGWQFEGRWHGVDWIGSNSDFIGWLPLPEVKP